MNADAKITAYAFTLAREEEIRQVEEEIAWIANMGFYLREDAPQAISIRGRILERLQAALNELRRGMKEASHEGQ